MSDKAAINKKIAKRLNKLENDFRKKSLLTRHVSKLLALYLRKREIYKNSSRTKKYVIRMTIT